MRDGHMPVYSLAMPLRLIHVGVSVLNGLRVKHVERRTTLDTRLLGGMPCGHPRRVAHECGATYRSCM